MRTVVVCKNMRPRLRPNLMEDNVGKFFVQMIVEMWEKGEHKLASKCIFVYLRSRVKITSWKCKAKTPEIL